LPRQFTICSGGCRPIHPDIESLIGHRDGCLPLARTRAIASHLKACEACRVEYERLLEALQPQSDAGPAATSLADTAQLASLLANVRAWETARGGPEKLSPAVQDRVAEALQTYLGARGTGDVLLRVSPDGSDLLSVVEPVLGLFLGCKAASALVTHIVDRAIVRI
jgi:anti-sigma factor RsiW